MTPSKRWLWIASPIGATLAVVLHASPAGAHTGHGTDGFSSGLTHPLLGIDHLAAMIAVGVLAVLIGRRSIAPAAFLGGMALGGTIALAGVELPFVETLIILSAFALGAAVIAGRATWWIPAVILVGVAGFFHGHAHGVEAPTSANPAAYVLAFLLATAALHAIGVGAGAAIDSRPRARAAFGTAVIGAGLGVALGVV